MASCPGLVVAYNLKRQGKQVWVVEHGAGELGTISGAGQLVFWPH